jgi:[protein-PII] uridylyltransferase
VIATPTLSERRRAFAANRRSRAALADEQLRSLWDQATQELDLPAVGAALVAVGGYGRGELSPASDLDLLLLTEDSYDDVALTPLAERLWYPLWDAHVSIDHSVRSVSGLRLAAGEDLRVALGTLDMRHIAGDPTLTVATRATVLADWRRSAKRRLPELAKASRERWRRVGDLAHAATPDLKEAHGGLRDVTMLRGLLASWLIDVPAAELNRLAADLLTVRDALHDATRRRTERLLPEYGEEVADAMGLVGPEALRSLLVSTGRSVGHLATVAVRTVDWLFTPRPSTSPRRPRLDPLAPGVAAHRGEVVLTGQVEPRDDPLLAMRAAEAAATRGLMLTDVAAARLGQELTPMPVPWPPEARSLLTRFLAAGPPLVEVWEALDQYGVVDRMLPEWKRVRHLAPQALVHRYTVDRHLVQTCVEASMLISGVDRPDLLVVAALLHDIGKGDETDHSELGEVIAWDIAGRLGFAEHDTATIARLVRHHLLLVDVATHRDLEDPATAVLVAHSVGDAATLQLLAVLTEADAKATGPQAWSPWRAQLVATLVERVAAHLAVAPRESARG